MGNICDKEDLFPIYINREARKIIASYWFKHSNKITDTFWTHADVWNIVLTHGHSFYHVKIYSWNKFEYWGFSKHGWKSLVPIFYTFLSLVTKILKLRKWFLQFLLRKCFYFSNVIFCFLCEMRYFLCFFLYSIKILIIKFYSRHTITLKGHY